uniref:THD domain-containing protein n=1 Tax=Scleropages formosus TaxID=113540 RepID=A0A8C9VLD2_SCLFO
MCQQQHQPRFHLLLVWCGLLTVAVVVMAATAMTSIPAPLLDKVSKDSNVTFEEQPVFSLLDHRFSHIQLTMGNWTRDLEIHWTDSSGILDFRNNSVFIGAEGLYFFYAHATFVSCKTEKKRTVTLFRNAIPGQKSQIKLSEVVQEGKGEDTVSVSKAISCERGDSVRLEIHPADCYKWNSDKTYWGFFLLTLSTL